MLHQVSFQPSISPQAHLQATSPAFSSRRGLAERKPGPGSSPGGTKALKAKAPSSRRGRVGTPGTNQEALAALKRSSDADERQALRSQLLQRNLPLVYAVTARMGRTLSLPQEDLRQIGSLGLLRAIDAYEPAQGRTLSSFAVPYIRGAIQHELRDRASLMRIPRPLWELRRRATVLQDRRRRLGQPQLAPAQLAEALDCSTSQVVEALQVSAVVDMRSLDTPCSGEAGDEATGRTLLDLLPDPATQAETPPAADLRELTREPCVPTGWPASPELSWLQHRLQALSPLERELVIGHVCGGRSWADMGRDLGLHPRQAQRRTVALLSRLQAEGRRWRSDAESAITPAGDQGAGTLLNAAMDWERSTRSVS